MSHDDGSPSLQATLLWVGVAMLVAALLLMATGCRARLEPANPAQEPVEELCPGGVCAPPPPAYGPEWADR